LLLAKLPKGTLGEDTSRLLGSFLFARVWQAALARAGQAPEQRRDAACYVDEVQNYLNLPTPFEDVLAEARSYRLSLCLAHQHLAQLPRDLREAIGANARTKVYFQLSRDDAATLDREAPGAVSARPGASAGPHGSGAAL
jgi:type IV secretory pathway TraG/TraD family ATPase VirD4